MNLAEPSKTKFISTVALREIVNEARAEYGEPVIRNDQFVARVEDELSDELEGAKKLHLPAPRTGSLMEAYNLTLDQAMLVGMRESKGVRRKVLEKLKLLSEPSAPKTFAEALRLAADQAELIERQQQALAIAGPKAAFVDQYVEVTGSMSFRQVAKLLKANERQFRQMLLDRGVMYYLGGVLTPYQQHMDTGRFEVKTGTSERNEHAFTQSRFTAKGVQWIAGIWAQYQMEIAA